MVLILRDKGGIMTFKEELVYTAKLHNRNEYIKKLIDKSYFSKESIEDIKQECRNRASEGYFHCSIILKEYLNEKYHKDLLRMNSKDRNTIIKETKDYLELSLGLDISSFRNDKTDFIHFVW